MDTALFTFDTYGYPDLKLQSCWYLSSETLNWADAEKYCQDRGGNLASVQDVADQSYLINYFDQVSFS